ncbi:uncharacterized protein LOC117289517 [Asterias rubens]|uniref:uncharacterized protein LOC117289517 n=1 Tax=Asterias rubens TaxID=7604 RepID=UPI001455C396|nr:uncharacterized protein LOC117289517 [Asterias rubens]
MDSGIALDLLWISATINLSTALFFAGRAVAGWLTGQFADRSGHWRKSLFVLQDEKPWFIPRLIVIVVQSAVLCLAGFSLLLQGDAIAQPFHGLGTSGRTCFAINIGCYMYLLIQDAILQRHLPNYYITFVHHLVAAVVYLVFLEYRQNVLGGAVGLLFAGATPFFEMLDFLKVLHVEEHHIAYGCSFAVSGFTALVFRLLLPLGFIIYSYTITSPFNMDILVIACYFLNIVFFGMLNMWFVYCAGKSLQASYRARKVWVYLKPLQAGKPHGLELGQKQSLNHQHLSFTATRNDLSLLVPCSNTNLAPTNLQNTEANVVTKDYQKINITEFLNRLDTSKSVATADETNPSSTTSLESVTYVSCPENLVPAQTPATNL